MEVFSKDESIFKKDLTEKLKSRDHLFNFPSTKGRRQRPRETEVRLIQREGGQAGTVSACLPGPHLAGLHHLTHF